MANTPIINEKALHHHSFVQISSRMQMPSNNILLYSTKGGKKRIKQVQSSKIIEAPIHQMSSFRQYKTANESSNGESAYLGKYGRLRISLQERRKKKQSFNSSCRSIYDHDIKKSKSLFLKKDFQSAFKKLIAKKQILHKQKQTKISHQLWSSMKVKKQTQLKDRLITQCLLTQRNEKPPFLEDFAEQKVSNKSEKKLIKKTLIFSYNQPENTHRVSQFYLSDHNSTKLKSHISSQRTTEKDKCLKTISKYKDKLSLGTISHADIKPKQTKERVGRQLNGLIAKKLIDILQFYYISHIILFCVRIILLELLNISQGYIQKIRREINVGLWWRVSLLLSIDYHFLYYIVCYRKGLSLFLRSTIVLSFYVEIHRDC